MTTIRKGVGNLIFSTSNCAFIGTVKPSNGIVALVSVLVITVISGYSSTFLLIGSKREQRGLNEPAVRPIQPAQEVVVPRYAVI